MTDLSRRIAELEAAQQRRKPADGFVLMTAKDRVIANVPAGPWRQPSPGESATNYASALRATGVNVFVVEFVPSAGPGLPT